MLYDVQLEDLKRTVQLAAGGTTIPGHLAQRDRASLLRYLEAVRRDGRCEFLALTNERGRVLLRATNSAQAGDSVTSISVVRAALSGNAAAATEIVEAGLLGREDPRLRLRARTRLANTPGARPFDRAEEDSGMVLMAAAPVRNNAGRVVGAL